MQFLYGTLLSLVMPEFAPGERTLENVNGSSAFPYYITQKIPREKASSLIEPRDLSQFKKLQFIYCPTLLHFDCQRYFL